MFKSKLQELCHRQQWPLPKYDTIREGPDHNARFRSTVAVNGNLFHSPDLSQSSKEAQNKAAQFAYWKLSGSSPPRSPATPLPSPSPPPPPPPRSPALPLVLDSQGSYKNQLQTYLLKKTKELPTYRCVSDGPSSCRFKAIVQVGEQTFESAGYFRLVKEAEQSAAKVALMSVCMEDNEQVDSIMYKNQLQELLQKEGLPVPKYSTTKYGEDHLPTFSTKVEAKGQCFQGEVAKTKKQAEINAAKVALSHLCKSAPNKFSSSNFLLLQVQNGRQPTTSRVQSIGNSLKPSNLLRPKSLTDDITAAEHGTTPGSSKSLVNSTVPDSANAVESPLDADVTGSTNEVDDSFEVGTTEYLPKVPATDDNATESAISSNDAGATTQKRPGPAAVMNNEETPKRAPAEHGSSASSSSSNSDCSNQQQAPKRAPAQHRSSASSSSSSNSDCSNQQHAPKRAPAEHRSSASSSSSNSDCSNQQHAPKRAPAEHGISASSSSSSSNSDCSNQQHTSKRASAEHGSSASSSSSNSDCSNEQHSAIMSDKLPAGRTASSLLCNRVQVYPRKSNRVLPDGAIPLPCSDDNWVAVGLDL